MLTNEWRRSSRCSTGGCVTARHVGVVEVADSKQAALPVLQFDPARWAEFIAAVRNGEFEVIR